jgi:protein TonB
VGRVLVALAGTAAFYGVVVLALFVTHPEHEGLAQPAPATQRAREYEVELPRPPKPKAEPDDPPPRERAAAARTRQGRVPSPPPAQAGAILARAADPNAPVDLGDGFVTGEGAVYAGGRTTSTGTSREAVRDEVKAAPRPRARPQPPPPDRSHAVALADEDWACPWPPEADADEVDERLVVVRVVVRPDGSVESARLVSDPGHGFGPAALSCARRSRFVPARDEKGTPIRAESPPVRVRFTR